MNKFGKGSYTALLIALVIHVATLLYFNLSTIKISQRSIDKTALLEIDYTEPEEIERIINPEEELQTPENNQTLKDLMKDIQDIREKSYEDFSENNDIEQEQLAAIEEENKKTIQELRDKGIKGFDESKFDINSTKKNEEKKNEDSSKKNNSYAGKVTVECNVPGRTCNTKKPTYKCKGGGKVYVEIRVDKIGRVKSANVVPSKSSTSNECILNNALNYARLTTKVSSDLSRKNSQTGYIIYNFISQ